MCAKYKHRFIKNTFFHHLQFHACVFGEVSEKRTASLCRVNEGAKQEMCKKQAACRVLGAACSLLEIWWHSRRNPTRRQYFRLKKWTMLRYVLDSTKLYSHDYENNSDICSFSLSNDSLIHKLIILIQQDYNVLIYSWDHYNKMQFHYVKENGRRAGHVCNILWPAEMFIHEITLMSEQAHYFSKEHLRKLPTR